MLRQNSKPTLVISPSASQANLLNLEQQQEPNLHFGWVCIDTKRLIVAFRGTESLHDWFDDFDFIPAPYHAIPGRGTVHKGFQFVYDSIRDNLRNLVEQHSSGCNELLITGHSLGGALYCAGGAGFTE
jgi:hypothetical protein